MGFSRILILGGIMRALAIVLLGVSLSACQDNMCMFQQDSATASAAMPVAEDRSHLFTNVQEAGIDEADYIKVGENHIFATHGNRIEIIERTTYAKLPPIELESSYVVRNSIKLVTHKNRLVVLAPAQNGGSKLRMLTYEIKPQGAALLKERQLDLRINAVRSQGGHLLLVGTPNSDFYYGEGYGLMSSPSSDQCSAQIQPANLASTSIAYLPPMNTKIMLFNIELEEQAPVEKEINFSTTVTYVSSNAIYLLGSLYRITGDFTQIVKINYDLSAGTLSDSKSAIVEGGILNEWSGKELADSSLFAITTNSWSASRLYILKDNEEILKVIGQSAEFGFREDLKSVRYIGDMAYVVTFLRKDPLFAIDLSNPTQPQITSELIVPGFSSYLHPVSNQLVGVGYDNGVKVSLFNIKNAYNISEVKSLIYGGNSATTEVATDYHAFFINSAENIFGAPMTEIETGFRLFELKLGSFYEFARLTHNDLGSSYCLRTTGDVNRVYEIGENLVSVSAFGLKIHDKANPKVTTKAIKFQMGAYDCP